MLKFPSPQELAKLVSGVTETMFGFSFALAPSSNEQPAPETWRAAAVGIGAEPWSVAIASDQPTGKRLGSFMFGLAYDEVDQTMVDDSLRELANIVAGRVKSSLGVDAALQLPKMVSKDQVADEIRWREATLQAHGQQVVVWVGILGADR